MDEATRKALKALTEAALSAKLALSQHARSMPAKDGSMQPNAEYVAIMELNMALEAASKVEME